MHINRRNFLKGTLASGLVFTLPSITTARQSKIYRSALIGSGWWGTNIARVALESGQNKLVALCDVDESQINSAALDLEKLSSNKPKRYKDFRELLKKEKPEIVIVATPDHWHALITIAAIEAGADVYVEKPICHTINEGKAMVKAARDAKAIVQVGTHRRASPHNISGINFLRQGGAGDIGMVRAFVHYGGGHGKVTPNSQPPEGLDWDFWCGPAPLVPFNTSIHPKGFRRFLNFANGQLGDWGIHWLDQILWWTEEKFPKTIYSTADRHILRDNTTAPDTQVVTYQFESFTATWEHRLYAGNNAEKHNIGCYFYGTKGTFHMGWLDGWTFYPSDRKKEIIHKEPKLNAPDQQNIKELWANFLDCVKSRQQPICDIKIGQQSTNMSLLGMLSYKLGRSIKWDGKKEIIKGDPEANKLLMREYRKPWKYPEI